MKNNPMNVLVIWGARRGMACLLTLLMLVSLCIPMNTVYAAGDARANIETVLPAGDGPYTVTYKLTPFADWGGVALVTEEKCQFQWTNGSASQSGLLQFTKNWERNWLQATLTGVEAGATITVSDVMMASSLTQPNIKSTKVMVTAVGASGNAVVFGDCPRLVDDTAAGTTLTFQEGVGSPTIRETTDTFTNRTATGGKEGEYDLEYLLTHYNVVSQKDIESTHIVGPIIAIHSAYRTGDDYAGAKHDGSDLVASDYAKGISSYVGKLSALETDSSVSALQLGYGFEAKNSSGLEVADFCPPHFYTREYEIDDDTIPISVHMDNGGVLYVDTMGADYVTLHRDGAHFLSPNALGKTSWGTNFAYTYQNDDFMDASALWNAVVDGSRDLQQYGVLNGDRSGDIIVEKQPVGTLNIQVGKSYLIEDATHLEAVNIVLPDDYDYDTNSGLEPTTITFGGATINPININGSLHSQFPATLINGAEFNEKDGKDGEYGEVGNKIIWNLPNLKTTTDGNRLVTVGNGANIAGHIVAPYAEFWNYGLEGGVVSWEGGNLNGAAIFKDFHSGNMEMHMWPYEGLEEVVKEPIETNFSFTKTDGHGAKLAGAEFTLTPQAPSTDLPIVKTSNSSGKFYVTLALSTTYRMEETKAPTGYQPVQGGWEIVVDEDGDITITPYGGAPVLSHMTIINEKITTPTMDINLTKENENQIPLEGATFQVQEAVDYDSDGRYDTLVESSYKETFTSDRLGKLTITGLPFGKAYRITEIVAPDGYSVPGINWVVVVKADGSGYDLYLDYGTGAYVPITDDVIINYSAYQLPLTGGIGTTCYYAVGIALMACGGIYLHTNIVSNKRRKQG